MSFIFLKQIQSVVVIAYLQCGHQMAMFLNLVCREQKLLEVRTFV